MLARLELSNHKPLRHLKYSSFPYFLSCFLEAENILAKTGEYKKLIKKKNTLHSYLLLLNE